MICPSRGRPNNVKRLWQAWKETTSVATLVIAVDNDDPMREQYLKIDEVLIRTAPRERLGPTLNSVALENCGHYSAIGFLGDDHLPRTPGWDVLFVKTLKRLKMGMVYGDDLHQRHNLPTAVAMTSNIIRSLGWMVPPGLVHLYIDNAWLDIGKATDIRYMPQVIIEHLHPHAHKAEWDAGYSEVEALDQQDAAVYNDWRVHSLPGDIQRLREQGGMETV